MDRATRNWTLFIIALFAMVSLLPLTSGDVGFSRVITLLGVALGAAMYAVSIRAVIVTEDAVVVAGRAGFRRYPLATIAGARVLAPDELNGAFRLLANGGLFGWSGNFFHPSIGRFRMNAVRVDRRIMLQFEDGSRFVVSADEPAGLVNAIERRRHAPRPT